jgi:hypothetical protein
MAFDFKAYQTFLDIWALEDYIQVLEAELPRIIENERKKIWEDVSPEDEQQTYYADNAELQLDEGLTTRFISGTALIATWALYESAVKRAATRLQESQKVELGLRDIKGSFPTAARKYFSDVLNSNLHPEGTDWDKLNVIYGLRNALAHANGQMEDINEKERERVARWASSFEGLKIAADYLIVDIRFVRRAFDFIKGLVEDLDNRLNSKT